MGLSDEQFLFLKDVIKLIQYSVEQGFKITPGEMLRTREQQEIYFYSGRSKTMDSQHLKGLAVDFNFFKDGVWINGLPGNKPKEILTPLGKYWEFLSEKNRWGGNFDKDWSVKDKFVDVPHFERTG